jgi:hypothetical protein
MNSDPLVVQPVASHYVDCTNPDPTNNRYVINS